MDSGILTLDHVRANVTLFRRFHDSVLKEYANAPPKLAIYDTLNHVLNALVTDLIEEVNSRVASLGAATLDDIRRAPERLAVLSPEMENERGAAKRYLYGNFYNSADMEEAHAHAARVVGELFSTLMTDPGLLPADHQAQIPTEGLARTVADYIAGMTDSYIEQLWQRRAQ